MTYGNEGKRGTVTFIDVPADEEQHDAEMLVIEAGKTVIVDREQMIADADGAGIIVFGRVSESKEEGKKNR